MERVTHKWLDIFYYWKSQVHLKPLSEKCCSKWYWHYYIFEFVSLKLLGGCSAFTFLTVFGCDMTSLKGIISNRSFNVPTYTETYAVMGPGCHVAFSRFSINCYCWWLFWQVILSYAEMSRPGKMCWSISHHFDLPQLLDRIWEVLASLDALRPKQQSQKDKKNQRFAPKLKYPHIYWCCNLQVFIRHFRRSRSAITLLM